jgi:hypothetical protein
MSIEEAIDEPSNIKWENMQYNSCLRKLRKIFSIFFTLIIVIISISIVAAAKFAEKKIEENGANVDCQYIKTSKEIVENEIKIEGGLLSPATQCYCIDEFKKIGLDVRKNILCEQWILLYLQSQSLNIGVIVIVPVLNVIISLALYCKIIYYLNYLFTFYFCLNRFYKIRKK